MPPRGRIQPGRGEVRAGATALNHNKISFGRDVPEVLPGSDSGTALCNG